MGMGPPRAPRERLEPGGGWPGRSRSGYPAAVTRAIELLRELFEEVVGPVPNPTFGERALVERIRGWLVEGGHVTAIDHGPWGLRFRAGSADTGTAGLLLSAHLDSSGVGPDPGVRFDRRRAVFTFPEGAARAGVDDKTGIVVLLALAALVRDARAPGFWGLLTTREEVGQRGALEMPIGWMKDEGIAVALAVDRRSDRHPDGCRHVVSSYHGVALDPEGRLADPLQAAVRSVTGEALADCPSPNCSDALELRGRWDAEIALADDALRERYRIATDEVRAAFARGRVGMYDPPRSSRYGLLRTIRQHLAHDAGLGVGNLSLDYREDTAELPAAELLTTVDILAELHRRLRPAP